MLNREGKMKTLLNIFGSILIFLGLVSAAGMAGDCDGKCMELANPMWLMLLIGFGSIVSMGLGAIMINQAGRIQ
jgi:hypothetical protein